MWEVRFFGFPSCARFSAFSCTLRAFLAFLVCAPLLLLCDGFIRGDGSWFWLRRGMGWDGKGGVRVAGMGIDVDFPYRTVLSAMRPLPPSCFFVSFVSPFPNTTLTLTRPARPSTAPAPCTRRSTSTLSLPPPPGPGPLLIVRVKEEG
jgi:hypothetical protein